MNGNTIVPLRFTSITNESNQVARDKPLKELRYRSRLYRMGLAAFMFTRDAKISSLRMKKHPTLDATRISFYEVDVIDVFDALIRIYIARPNGR